MPFPEFDPILLRIGPFAIRWYALAYVAGILLGWRYAATLIKRPTLWAPRLAPMSTNQLDDLILWVTLGVVIGGRLGHVLFYTPELIVRDPLEILKVWNGGMSFHGGLIGVGVALSLFARAQKVDLLRLGDLAAAAAPIGLCLGRIANFINGELWGRPTDLPWGVVFPNAGPFPRHPSQLYESALEGVVLFLVLAILIFGLKLTRRRGVIAGVFLIGYGLIRTLLEQVREPDFGMPDFPLGLTMGMMLSAPMVLAGLFLVWRGLGEPRPAQSSGSETPDRAA
ncbi:prolipoprotein diacylglyceryl transferase [Phenylobacterium immobile]|uniref:prolipoprotein diacylglyceryl transferase n=1 Tax=Phenylobacterium immobile TaxID=21 RepID=UPI000A55B463|nr:prolipoprotein diacylglyceryl transferase [Phenylobacterium immobile]